MTLTYCGLESLRLVACIVGGRGEKAVLGPTWAQQLRGHRRTNRNGTPLRGGELAEYRGLDVDHRGRRGHLLVERVRSTSLQPIGSVLRPVRQTKDVSSESSLVGFGFGRPSCIERIERTNQLSSQQSPLFGGTRPSNQLILEKKAEKTEIAADSIFNASE
ncbi:hypothetical protein EDB83DRAFT_2315681 [Lactarius deliciosus]|nr:hypothetical protein EDB83DRAFT_2315681 [Lactarius deliciosus]